MLSVLVNLRRRCLKCLHNIRQLGNNSKGRRNDKGSHRHSYFPTSSSNRIFLGVHFSFLEKLTTFLVVALTV